MPFQFFTPNIGPRDFEGTYAQLNQARAQIEANRAAAVGVLTKFFDARHAEDVRRQEIQAQQAHERGLITLRGALEAQALRERAQEEAGRFRQRQAAELAEEQQRSQMQGYAESVFQQAREGGLVSRRKFPRLPESQFSHVGMSNLESHLLAEGTRKPESAKAFAEFLKGDEEEFVIDQQQLVEIRNGLVQRGIPTKLIDAAQGTVLGDAFSEEDARANVRKAIASKQSEFIQVMPREDITSATERAIGVPRGTGALTPEFLKNGDVNLDLILTGFDKGRSTGVITQELASGGVTYRIDRDKDGRVLGVTFEGTPDTNPQTLDVLNRAAKDRQFIEGIVVSDMNPAGNESPSRLRSILSDRGVFDLLGTSDPDVERRVRSVVPRSEREPAAVAPADPFGDVLEFLDGGL